ncbi:TylF/MycF/NovP-related O-methyltransferase [Sulfurimonas sp. HSL-1716]|uniref:TylF/MycF/NovP-related O-methyltransferase n=1 Tax=Hydrocurvibacter sulfurireducens TaxID=3131937 RepID=UPI0031FA2609
MSLLNIKERYVFSRYLNELNREIEAFRQADGEFILYGFGIVGEYIYSKISEKISSIVDMRYLEISDLTGFERVYAPTKLPYLEHNKIIVTVLGREEKIIDYLINELNIDKDRISVIKIGKQFSKVGYENIFSNANYAPWKIDNSFFETFEIISTHTLVDIYKAYELWELVQQTSKLAEGSLIEVGVWRGGTGTLIAKRAQDCDIREHIYLCDTFSGVVKSSEHDTYYFDGEHADTSIEYVEDLIRKLDLKNVEILTGIFPDDTSFVVKDKKFRFCHIDVDVYKSAIDIVDWIWERLVVGGMIVFDDYGFESCDGITKFVNEQRQLTDRMVIYNLNGHAIVIKIS